MLKSFNWDGRVKISKGIFAMSTGADNSSPQLADSPYTPAATVDKCHARRKVAACHFPNIEQLEV